MPSSSFVLVNVCPNEIFQKKFLLSRNPNYGGKEGGGQILNKEKIFNLINGILRKCMVIQNSTMLVRHIKADDVHAQCIKSS